MDNNEEISIILNKLKTLHFTIVREPLKNS